MSANGYSLLEMLFVLAIAATAVGVSVPFLAEYRAGSDFESAAAKVVSQIRRTKMLAVTSGEGHSVCVPVGKPNSGDLWRFFTIRRAGESCGGFRGKPVMETAVSHRVFRKGGRTGLETVTFLPRGTSTNRSFCIESRSGGRWKKITVSNFARITVTSHAENPCD